MKICLVSDNLVGYHDTWSGAEMIVKYLETLLRKEGKDVALLTLKSSGRETPKGIFPVPALTGPIWNLKKIIPIHILIRTIGVFLQLKKMKPDILHLFHSNSLFIPVMICAKILKIPTTYTVLDYWIACPTGHFLLENGDICKEREGVGCKKCVSPIKFLERRLVRHLAKNLETLITFTETSKKRLVERGFRPEIIKVRYVYEFKFGNFSDAPKAKAAADILAVCTSFSKQKGLEVIIKTMPYVVEKFPDAKLSVIGRGQGSDKERIENLVKELRLTNVVRFLGQKKNEETLQLISRSSILVVAEQWFSDFGPVVLIEAMAQGCPVVSGSIGSSPDFIKDGFNGYLAEYNNPKSFAEKIILALQNKERAFGVGQNAKETIKNIFSGEAEKEILNFYAR